LTTRYKVKVNAVTSRARVKPYVVELIDYTDGGRSYKPNDKRHNRGIAISMGEVDKGNDTYYMSADEAEELGTALLYFAKLGRGEISD